MASATQAVGIDADVSALPDSTGFRFTKHSPAIPLGTIRAFINCSSDGRSRIRKEHDYFVNDSPWGEKIADQVAFDADIQQVSLWILDHKDVTVKEELMADLQRIEDPTQRWMATQAVMKEIKDLCEMGVFEVIRAEDAAPVPLGETRKVIGSKMVLKVKYKADGSYDKHKGRMVVLGYQERPGWEFHSTFSSHFMANAREAGIAIHWIEGEFEYSCHRRPGRLGPAGPRAPL